MDCFALKTQICMSSDPTPCFRKHGVGRVCIVCDPFLEQTGILEQITDQIKESGIEWEVFSQVVPDPTIDVVSQGVKRMMAFQPEAVIALGGGSAIDTGKAISYIYTKLTGRPKPLYMAIPTTSGTGSEVTSFSVVTDPTAQLKHPLSDEKMIPDIALLDPKLTLSVPSRVTADTGMDVLTHAIEAYISPKATDFSDAMAEKAVRLVFAHLATAVRDGSNLEARKRLHNASCMAGIAFENASLGLCHGMAHALGGQFHLPHGQSNAVLLPHVVAYNAELEERGTSAICLRYAKLAATLGIHRASPKAAVARLVEEIRELSCTINIPKGLVQLGIQPTAFTEKLEQLAQNALSDKCTATNPRLCTKEQIVGIYKAIMV